ncbi:MAG: phosphotransferase [Thermodesulfobacteriota bacterium]
MPIDIPAESRAALHALLERCGIVLPAGSGLECLSGDGSDRVFVRCAAKDGRRLLAALPSRLNAKGMAEARAAFVIGRHLFGAGVAVPEVMGFDEESGILLMEDLGDELLYHRAQHHPAETAHWYRLAIEALVLLQVQGAPGFPQESCWDTPAYDKALMLDRESDYFYQALCRDFLGMGPMTPELAAEFEALAGRAGREPAGFVLHRDFQSRNLMIQAGRIRIVDFQGARLGPLGYDLAALLIDPYVDLPQALRAELFDHYCQVAARMMPFDRDAFAAGYFYLALQRNLQMLGAFAFLSQQRGKPFFAAYLRPASEHLLHHLALPAGKQFPHLAQLARNVAATLAGHKEISHGP